MRKLAIGLGLACFCLLCSGNAYAESYDNENLNARIKMLQERLKEFQKRDSVHTEEDKKIIEEEFVDLIFDRKDESLLPTPEKIIDSAEAEKLVEEFENRNDVAMTVLFHDNSEGFFAVSKNFASIEPPRVFMDDYEPAEPVLSESTEMAAAVKPSTVIDSDYDRQQLYEELRRKVYAATRSRESAMNMASLPNIE